MCFPVNREKFLQVYAKSMKTLDDFRDELNALKENIDKLPHYIPTEAYADYNDADMREPTTERERDFAKLDVDIRTINSLIYANRQAIFITERIFHDSPALDELIPPLVLSRGAIRDALMVATERYEKLKRNQ